MPAEYLVFSYFYMIAIVQKITFKKVYGKVDRCYMLLFHLI